MIDVWMGDDFFHNGAFRQSYGYDYTLGMESSKENAFSKLDEDGYDFFLRFGSFEAAAKQGGVDRLPTAAAFLKHPAYDDFWRSRGVEWHLDQVSVPTLFVGGFWDQEDMFGPQEAYSKIEPHDSHRQNFLVIGPWNHGQWGATTRRLGAIEFGEATTDEFRGRYEAPFFAYYLKDEPGFNLKGAAAFESGANRWREYTHWPPAESKSQNLYLSADGSLVFSSSDPANTSATKSGEANAGQANYRQYISDPANPVPYRHRPIQATYAPGSQWYTWLAEDQRFVSGRPDVATWTTPPLDSDVTVAGDVIADLFASTSGTDSDWVVKLIDEYPDSAAARRAGSTKTQAGHGRLSADYQCGDFSRPLPPELRASRGDSRERHPRISLQPSCRRSHIPQGPSHRGAGAEHLVPAVRPQPAEIRSQHHERIAGRFLEGHPTHLSRFSPGPPRRPVTACSQVGHNLFRRRFSIQ